MSPIIEVLIPGIPGPPGPAIQVTGPGVIGRESGTGAGGSITVGTGLTITGGTLRATATDLAYDPATRLLSSSTGADVTLPLATTTAAGLMSAADKALVGEAFIVTIEVRNNTGAEIPAGAACREVGSSGDLPTVALASASDEVGSSKTLGLARTAIPNNSTGRLITLGRLEGISTSGLTEGATVWLGTTPGSLTTTRPTQPAHGVVLGLCIRSGPGGSGILFVRVANGQELNELHDVLITGSAPAAGAPRPALARSTDGLWRDVVLGPADVGADAAGSAAAAVAAHATAADPHSQYTTAAEAAAAAPVQSVVGRTGNVTLSTADIGDLGATLAGYVQTGDSRLTDAREWTASTISQAEAEAGTATTRRAFTAERVRQAVAAWWLAISSSVGRAVVTAADQAAARAAIGAVGGAAGTSGQLQWSDGGAFAGVPSSTVDGTSGAVSLARLLLSANAAASLPPLALTGTWFSGGTATTTKPHLLIEPAGTSSTAWSTAGTGLGINAPSGFLGNPIDAQINGTKIFVVASTGTVSLRNVAEFYLPDNFSVGIRAAGSNTFAVTNTRVGLASTAFLGWSSNANSFAALDLTLFRDAANILALRNGVNAQSLRMYGTFTDASNFLRGAINATSSQVSIGVERAGTAAANAPLVLSAAGTGTVRLDSLGEIGASSTVAALPASPTNGTFVRVTDALAPTVGSVVVGGGSSQAIVWWDNGAWRVWAGTAPSGATPAGAATEIQYRNAGALGAIPGSAVDGTTGGVTLARLLLTANGAASASPLNLNGAWFTGGTSTNNFPQLLISPTGATLPTFNTAGMGAVINAQSGFSGDIIWLGVNGSARFTLNANGPATFSGAVASGGTTLTGDVFGGLRLASQAPVSWGNVNNVVGGGPDTRLWRSDVGVIDQKSNAVDAFSGNTPSAVHPHAQTFRIFNHQVNGTNFECASIGWQRGSSDAVFTGSITAAGILTVTGVTSGTIAVNQIITGANVPPGTRIVSLGTGSGGTGTYNVSVNVAVSSTTITGGAPVLRIAAEKGTGGGTARDIEIQTDGITRIIVKANGAIQLLNLPTTSPGVANQLWRDGDFIKIV